MTAIQDERNRNGGGPERYQLSTTSKVERRRIQWVHGALAARTLPGVRYSRHLLGRYSLVWRKPRRD